MPSLLTMCAPLPTQDQQEFMACIDPLAFFVGPTEATGHLKRAFVRPRATLVQSLGVMQGDTLVLDQAVVVGHQAGTRRQWHIVQTAPGRVCGTRTDTFGGFTGELCGNRLHLLIAMTDGLHAEQWLTLNPDGRSAQSTMTVRKWGLPAATLIEDIRRTD